MDESGSNIAEAFSLLPDSPSELSDAVAALRAALTTEERNSIAAFQTEYSRIRNGRDIFPKILRRYCRRGVYEPERLLEMVRLVVGSRLAMGTVFIGSEVTEEELEQLEMMKRYIVEKSEGDVCGSRFYDFLETYPGRRDDTVLLRYLRVRAGWQAAADNVMRTAAWRNSVRPHMILKTQVENPGRTGKARWQGFDKQGRPTMVIFPCRHFPGETTVEETMTFSYWSIEQGIILAKQQNVDQINVIYDRRGASRANFDLGIARSLSALQDHFAETFCNIFIVGADWLYHALFAVVSPFMDKRTIDKIIELAEPRDLLEYFDPDQLLVDHGGTLEDSYDWATYRADSDLEVQARIDAEAKRTAAIEAADPRTLEEKFYDAADSFACYQTAVSSAEFDDTYGLFQQATEGDNSAPKPWAIGRGKWGAWESKKGMSRDEAMKRYISTIKALEKKYS